MRIGPIEASGRKPWLARLVELLKQPWFYGDKDRHEIESWLKVGKDGEYLVRFSTTEPLKCPFTISINIKPKKKKSDKKSKSSSGAAMPTINHVRVFYEDSCYHIHKPPPNHSEKVSAPTLEALMKKVKEEKVLGIKEVCSKGLSPYSYLFAPVSGGIPAGSYLPCNVDDDEDSDSPY